MPTYLYLCETTNEEFEEFHSISSVLDDCPLCKEAGRQPHKPKRLIAGGSGRGIVELTGYELEAKIKSDGEKLKRQAMQSENTLANLVGEGRYHSNELDRSRSRRR